MKVGLLLFIATLCFGQSWALAQCNGRYTEKVFDNISIQTDVLYGNAVDPISGNPMDLFMDIYQPVGDVEQERPVILLAFGGSFIGGSKDSPDIVAMCDSLAHYGYVTAAIQYRLEEQVSLLQVSKMIEIIMMASHDGKAAVRFFRRDAAEDNEYKIDPARIFMGGVSAGGILSTHLAYLNAADNIQGVYLQALNNLGVGYEGASGNPGYSSEVQGVLNIAGALGLPDWMDAGEAPLASMHSIGDPTVLYDVGPPLGAFWLPDLYGSGPLHVRADAEGIRNSLLTYPGSAHPAYNTNGGDFVILSEHIAHIATFLAPEMACYCNDADLDGVCDADDVCPGSDDNLDSDMDGIPDDCDLVEVNLRIFLQGAMSLSGNDMRADLLNSSLLPNAQPYDQAPYNFTATVTVNSFPVDVVDWVLVEARSGTPATSGLPQMTVQEQAVGLLLTNGDIVNPSGSGALRFTNLTPGESYHFAVRHRNHLDVMTATAFSINAQFVAYDFSTSISQAFGVEQLVAHPTSGLFTLYAGDYKRDGIVQNTDYDVWEINPSIVNSYEAADGNLDGTVQTTDFDKWSANKAKLGTTEIQY